MKNNLLRALALLSLCFVIVLSLLACSEEKTPVTVSFVWNNGLDPTTVEVEEGNAPAVPEIPERFGYAFAGWFLEPELTTPVSPATVPVSADTTYFAAWTTEQSLRVVFDTKGGSDVPSAVVKKGETLTESQLAAPTKEGYTFAGWYKNDACTSAYHADVAPIENMTLFAGWKLNDGMGECVGTVNGREIARTVFAAGTPVLPTTDDGVSYIWYADSALKTVFSETNVSSSVTLYGVAYTEGLAIENGVVTGYTGTVRNVIVPALWDGKTVTEIAARAFAQNAQIKTVTLPETIKTVGDSAFYGCDSLSSVNLTPACTSLGAYAFYGCQKMVSVGDLSGLTAIADSAFLGCRRLTALALSDHLRTIGKYAFADCVSMETFRLSDSVISIGEYAFSGCTAVKEFYIPKGLVTLGTGALSGCTALQKLTCPADNATAAYRLIDGNLYEGNGKKLVLYVRGDKQETSFKLPAGANAVAAYAFSGNTNLTELILDDEGVTVEKAALAGMKALEKLSIYTLDGDNGYLAYYFGADSGEANGSAGNFSPASLKTVSLKKAANTLPDYAFYGFTGLNEVQGLSKLRKVGKYAFAYTGLVDVTIPVTLTAIGEQAFVGCSSVRAFTVEEGNTTYAAYDGCLYNKALTELYLVPLTKTEIRFPGTVTKITSGAFFKSNVRVLEIPATVKTIESGAFAGVLGLEELTVPFIGGSADKNTYMIYIFGGSVQSSLQSDGTTSYSIGNTSCTPPSLKKLTVSGSVSVIPDFAFAYLSNVSEIVCNGTITEIGAYAYCKSGLTELNVPATVKKIGEYAFAAMDELENAVIPGSVGGNLGEAIFFNCSALETVVFEEGVTLIPVNAFYPSSSRDYETGELNYYSNLESVTLPSTIEKIGEYAFAYAGTSYIGEIGSIYSELKFILPAESNLKTLDKGAFYRSSIGAIALPSCFTEVGEMAFFGCRRLATVSFGCEKDGSGLTRFGGAAFAMCTGLQKLTIYKDVKAAADVPAIELYTVSSTTENISYNLFAGAVVPTICVRGAEIYRNAENWDEYDTRIFALN